MAYLLASSLSRPSSRFKCRRSSHGGTAFIFARKPADSSPRCGYVEIGATGGSLSAKRGNRGKSSRCLRSMGNKQEYPFVFATEDIFRVRPRREGLKLQARDLRTNVRPPAPKCCPCSDTLAHATSANLPHPKRDRCRCPSHACSHSCARYRPGRAWPNNKSCASYSPSGV